MRKPDFEAFYKKLLHYGIAPRHARRARIELQDHFQDLVEENRGHGLGDADARQEAAAALGRVDDLVAEMSRYRELKTWAYRYPRFAVVFYPLACLLALPAAPVVAGVENASVLARWGASLIVAGVFTGVMLLVLQLSILFG